MKISLIVATDLNGAIGKNNTIPWKQKTDMKRFKEMTMGKCIVMGSKTFESLGKPLKGRLNIVLTKSLEKRLKYNEYDNVVVFHSIENLLSFCMDRNEKEVMVIGGGQIYDLFLNRGLVDVIYLTEIETLVENADTFFSPLTDRTSMQLNRNFDLEDISYHNEDEENEFGYSFKTVVFK